MRHPATSRTALTSRYRESARRLSKREVVEKLQGKALLIARADLSEQLYCWGEGFVRSISHDVELDTLHREPRRFLSTRRECVTWCM